jgi:hypothetical protein
MAFPGSWQIVIIAAHHLPGCSFVTPYWVCNADSMLETAYLALGKIAPDWQQLELHVGGATVASAVSEATGVTR